MFEEVSESLRKRISQSVALMREVSLQTDPEEMVRRYSVRAQELYPRDAALSLSRRGLEHPYYRVTRSSQWKERLDPWKDKLRLPLFKGGLLADLLYGNEPRIIDDLYVRDDDPALEYLTGMGSLLALPLYDGGESLNMLIRLMRRRGEIKVEHLPDQIVMSNLFGRATRTLVLAGEVRGAYDALDSEFSAIAEMQRSLLPTTSPDLPGLDCTAFYATAHRAGGDYYDFFPLARHRSGILIADVSGHGAAAAVVMARMHATLHAGNAPLDDPPETLSFVNDHLLLHCRQPTNPFTFVTAFYAVYDPAMHVLHYSSAGHNPPRLLRSDGCLCSISGARHFPLGIECGVTYELGRLDVEPGDIVLLYTDGIVEAANPRGEMFETDRLDAVLTSAGRSSQAVIDDVTSTLSGFIENAPTMDDQTIVAFRVDE